MQLHFFCTFNGEDNLDEAKIRVCILRIAPR